MANRWEKLETVSDFILLGSKINADGDCSHEIKRHLLLGRKVMTKLDSIFKSRDITLPTKIRLVKAMFFPVVMYGPGLGTEPLPGALCSGTGSPALGLCSHQPKRTGEGPKPHPHDSTLGESCREAPMYPCSLYLLSPYTMPMIFHVRDACQGQSANT